MRRLFPTFGRPAELPPSAPVALQAMETKGDVERRFTSGGPYLTQGVPYRGTWSPERAVQDGLERVVWVFRCVDAIASDESRLPITWREEHPEEGDELKPDAEPLWKLLNRRANPYESAGSFRYRLSCQLLLCKQGVFVELVRNRAKELTAVYLLPPHRTAPIPDPDKFVSGYEVYGASGEIYRLPAERVLWIRRPHPLDPYMGLVPMEAAGLAVDVDFYARIYNRNFMMNDGRPGGIVNVKGFLSEDDARELEARFNGGPGRAGKVSVLESDGIEYVDAATNARDMQHVETRQATKKEILMAFGVPETRAGDSSQRTFDNADAEIEMYWRDTMRAHNDLIDSAFDSVTAGGVEDNIFTVHDTSSVYVLNRDEKDKEQRYQNQWDKGLITADEYREATGRDPLKRPGSKVLWVANQGKLPVGEEEDEKAAMEAAMGGGGQAGPGGPAAPGGGPEALPPPEGITEGGGETGGGGGGGGRGPSAAPPAPSSPFDWDAYEIEEGGSGADFSVENAIIGKAWGNGHGNGHGYKEAALTEAPVNSGIMVSIDLPPATARRLLDMLLSGWAGPSEPAEELHITLIYLGKVATAPFSVDDVLEAIEAFTSMTAPLACAISGIGHFSIPEGTATYASVDSPALPPFRERLVAALKIKDVESPSQHGFTPHITLAYTEPGQPPPDIPIEELSGQLDLLTFPVPEIVVHWGDVVYRFPLRGQRKQLVDLGETKDVRRVRTPEGSRRYGVPVGSIIRSGAQTTRPRSIRSSPLAAYMDPPEHLPQPSRPTRDPWAHLPTRIGATAGDEDDLGPGSNFVRYRWGWGVPPEEWNRIHEEIEERFGPPPWVRSTAAFAHRLAELFRREESTNILPEGSRRAERLRPALAGAKAAGDNKLVDLIEAELQVIAAEVGAADDWSWVTAADLDAIVDRVLDAIGRHKQTAE